MLRIHLDPLVHISGKLRWWGSSFASFTLRRHYYILGIGFAWEGTDGVCGPIIGADNERSR